MATTASDLLPEWDVGDVLLRRCAPAATAVYQALKRWDLAAQPLNRLLFGLRDLPARLSGHRHGGMRQLLDRPPPPLLLDPDRAVAFGMAARPWQLHLELQLLDAAGFAAFATPGFCRILWHFGVQAGAGGGSRLELHTRVQALGGPQAQRRLRLYWRAMRPLSQLVRERWLDDVARLAAG